MTELQRYERVEPKREIERGTNEREREREREIERQ